ncbi:MAG: hypothetical protein ACYTKD_12520 [Planctomycetota bacterium]|jgi:hypothetical protein
MANEAERPIVSSFVRRWRSLPTFAVVALLFTGACESKEQRIRRLARAFRAAPHTQDAQEYGYDRTPEVYDLIRLGGIRKGMSRAELEGLLGKCESPWEDVPPVHDFDLRLLYGLSAVGGFEFFLKNGELIDWVEQRDGR